MESTERLSDLLATALGPEVTGLLRDELVSEIRLNADGSLWVHRLGEGKSKSDALISPINAQRAIYAVAFGVNEICNESHPSIAAELPKTGERFQGVIPPLSKSPVFAIRKKAIRVFSLDDLQTQGVITVETSEFLKSAVHQRKNILVVGGTDSGKTTFANALLQAIEGSNHRIVILEE